MKPLSLAVLILIAVTVLLASSRKGKLVDVRTGRARVILTVLGIKLSDRVSETKLSKEWKKHDGGELPPDWREESTTPIVGKVSPNKAYLGAFTWEESITYSFELFPFDEGLKAKIVNKFLFLLSSNPSAARDYATDLLTFAASNSAKTNTSLVVPASFTNSPYEKGNQ